MDNITGIRLRKLRKEKKLTGEQLGKILGVTKTAVSYWETGRVKMDDQMMIKVADYFEVTTDYLLGRDDKRNRPTTAYDIDKNYEKLDPEIQQVFHDLANMSEEDLEFTKQFIKMIKEKNKGNK